MSKENVDVELLFELARRYYRKNSSVLVLEYDTKVALMALYKQATMGKFDDSKEEKPGFFDFVGKDIRAAWENLEDMSQLEAEEKFYELLAEASSEFKEWVVQCLKEKAERERRERERQERERLERERREREEQERKAKEERERKERERLARLKSEEADRQRLQTQLEEQKRQQQQKQNHVSELSQDDLNPQPLADITLNHQVPQSVRSSEAYIKAFREALQGNPDSEVVVNSGEVLTVRVPKPKSPTAKIAWQFNTLSFDISFGVDFERENDDGSLTVEPVLPTRRCNSHEEVVFGSHVSTSTGTWLLKFDNSYSYFRSKTVFYRVICSVL